MEEIQIIGVDVSHYSPCGDYSAISSICSSCESVLESKLYEPDRNDISLTYFKACPVCKTVFKAHRIMEELP